MARRAASSSTPAGMRGRHLATSETVPAASGLANPPSLLILHSQGLCDHLAADAEVGGEGEEPGGRVQLAVRPHVHPGHQAGQADLPLAHSLQPTSKAKVWDTLQGKGRSREEKLPPRTLLPWLQFSLPNPTYALQCTLRKHPKVP